MKEIAISRPLKKETVLMQLGRLCCHYPNSGHTERSMEVVAQDWYEELREIPDDGFVGIINEVLRTTRFFPVIADLWSAAKKTGLDRYLDKTCSTCKLFCAPESPDHCHKQATNKACKNYE